jgi:hypothetical protein
VEKYVCVRQATDDNTTWSMDLARFIPKAANTYPESLMLIAFPQQQRLCERVSMFRYKYISFLVTPGIRSANLNK